MEPKRPSTEKAETPNKRPTRNYKKKEEKINSSSDGPNGLLNNTNDTNISLSKNTRPKRTYTKRQKETVPSPPNELPNNPQTKKKRGPKKKIASAPSSQIINELLKDDNGPLDNKNGHKDDEVLNEDFNDDDPNEDGSKDPEDDGSEPKDDDNRSSQLQQNTQLNDNQSSRLQQNSKLNKKDQEYDLSEESEDDESFYETMSQGLKNSSSMTQAKGMNSQSTVQPNRTMSSTTSRMTSVLGSRADSIIEYSSNTRPTLPSKSNNFSRTSVLGSRTDSIIEYPSNRLTLAPKSNNFSRTSVLDSRADDIIEYPSNRPTPAPKNNFSRTSVLDSRADDTIDYPSNRPTPALESRNNFSRTSRTMAVQESRTNKPSPLDKRSRSIFPESRTNGSLEYALSPTRPTSLVSRDNSMNVLHNNSNYHFDTIGEILPSPFDEMTINQLCSWLCVHPNILQLANNMHLSMQMLAVDGSRFVPSNLSTMPRKKENNKTKDSLDFLEELKCLFLRARDPPKSVFDELIVENFNCELNSDEAIEWLQIATRDFGDFRNKLLNSVENLVSRFKEQRTLPETSPPQREEIISFVDESETAQILKRQLSAVNMTEFRRKNSMYYLCRFIQHAFLINYSSRETDETKTLDRLTKEIAVPSRNGKNLAHNLRW